MGWAGSQAASAAPSQLLHSRFLVCLAVRAPSNRDYHTSLVYYSFSCGRPLSHIAALGPGTDRPSAAICPPPNFSSSQQVVVYRLERQSISPAQRTQAQPAFHVN